jgi:hypothetical protein
MRVHIDAGGDMMGAVGVDQSAYAHLEQFDALAGRNAQQVFTEMEWEQAGRETGPCARFRGPLYRISSNNEIRGPLHGRDIGIEAVGRACGRRRGGRS